MVNKDEYIKFEPTICAYFWHIHTLVPPLGDHPRSPPSLPACEPGSSDRTSLLPTLALSAAIETVDLVFARTNSPSSCDRRTAIACKHRGKQFRLWPWNMAVSCDKATSAPWDWDAHRRMCMRICDAIVGGSYYTIRYRESSSSPTATVCKPTEVSGRKNINFISDDRPLSVRHIGSLPWSPCWDDSYVAQVRREKERTAARQYR